MRSWRGIVFYLPTVDEFFSRFVEAPSGQAFLKLLKCLINGEGLRPAGEALKAFRLFVTKLKRLLLQFFALKLRLLFLRSERPAGAVVRRSRAILTSALTFGLLLY